MTSAGNILVTATKVIPARERPARSAAFAMRCSTCWMRSRNTLPFFFAQERGEPSRDLRSKLGGNAVSGSLRRNQPRAGWNQTNRGFQFLNRSKRITSSMDKQRGHLQGGEMFRTEFRGLAWRMQRIREQ